MRRILLAALTIILLSGCSWVPLQYLPEGSSEPVTFNYGDPEPVKILYHDVATGRGWSPEEQEAWLPFSLDVWAGESAFCPNVRRGAKFVYSNGAGCVISVQGPHSDSGIGQVLMGYPNRSTWLPPFEGGSWDMHEHASWLCPQEGLCTPESVVATPEASMTAYLALLEHSGKAPWCYDPAHHARACKNAPSGLPNS